MAKRKPKPPAEPAAVWVATEELVPWDNNPKVHEPGQVEKICDSIRTTAEDAAREAGRKKVNLLDGWGAPLTARVADKSIVAGHGRVLAAFELGIPYVPVRFLGISEKQAQRLCRADNRLGEPIFAPWDEPLLLEGLQADFDDGGQEALDWQGFDAVDFEALLAGEGLPLLLDDEPAEDEGDAASDGDELEDPPVPDPPKNPVTKLGDMWELGRHVLVCGSVMDGLPFADGEAQTCVTSPPYWGLRDYGEEGQLGLEKTPEEHCERMVQVFSEVRRVLRADGTCWMNYGDCYAMGTKGAGGAGKQHTNAGSVHSARGWQIPPGLKPKDLVGMPWMVAFALRADGSHEYIFLLAAAARYYYDADAIREKTGNEATAAEYAAADGHTAPSGNLSEGVNAGFGGRESRLTNPLGRNKRSVWTVTPKPYAEAHFATFPPDLIVPCIKAGSGEGERSMVLDPFMGAGTTIVVAEQLGRKAIGTELSPAYCDIIVQRWEQLTGGKAKRAKGMA
jgi:hypothetical protein